MSETLKFFNGNQNFKEELELLLITVDEGSYAFDFFSKAISQARFEKLCQVARILLGLLPSPAICQQDFSRAVLLTDGDDIDCLSMETPK